MHEAEGWNAATSLPSAEMTYSVWVMSDASAEDGRLMGIVAGHGHLAVMEMGTWLQWNTRLELSG